MTKGHLGLETTSKELSTKEDEVEAAIVKKPRGWSGWASTIKMGILSFRHYHLYFVRVVFTMIPPCPTCSSSSRDDPLNQRVCAGGERGTVLPAKQDDKSAVCFLQS